MRQNHSPAFNEFARLFLEAGDMANRRWAELGQPVGGKIDRSEKRRRLRVRWS